MAVPRTIFRFVAAYPPGHCNSISTINARKIYWGTDGLSDTSTSRACKPGATGCSSKVSAERSGFGAIKKAPSVRRCLRRIITITSPGSQFTNLTRNLSCLRIQRKLPPVKLNKVKPKTIMVYQSQSSVPYNSIGPLAQWQSRTFTRLRSLFRLQHGSPGVWAGRQCSGLLNRKPQGY